jgi:hypothetical protein
VTVPPDSLEEAFHAAAVAAADVANYCDHVEHVEVVDCAVIVRAGETYRRLALELANEAGLDIFGAYADRLAAIEHRNVLAVEAQYDGEAAARSATVWSDLQRVQLAHDRAYHPDVLGLARIDQLRHYAFHLSKLVGALAEVAAGEISWDEFARTRLVDMLLFGIKLATLTNTRLPDEPLR